MTTRVSLTPNETIVAKQKALAGYERYRQMCEDFGIDVELRSIQAELLRAKEKAKLRILQSVVYGGFFVVCALLFLKVYCAERGLQVDLPQDAIIGVYVATSLAVVGLYFKLNKATEVKRDMLDNLVEHNLDFTVPPGDFDVDRP